MQRMHDEDHLNSMIKKPNSSLIAMNGKVSRRLADAEFSPFRKKFEIQRRKYFIYIIVFEKNKSLE